uniref:hypothetical protein n=1 Tax=Porodaedalea niemelaei TaxID=175858 RepID=UPI0023AAEEE0|nr:hypothetical protein P1R16_mgp09 [Porodaedalea niemelaei]YP_010697832.1 hypothetical protein P1S03_mgp13 [Porodaedalea chrysoloma]WCF76683.1 hypothetical protein [Porodaedalea niemelaei]WCF76793.1 hypothetical protein [Porodaedalea chrysoloma]
MKIKTINLKTKINNKVLRDNMFKFFRRYNDKSQFITVITKISTESSNSQDFVLNNQITLDVKSKSDITTYVNIITDKFNEYNNEIKKYPIKKILIYYYDSNNEEYLNYIKTSWLDLLDKNKNPLPRIQQNHDYDILIFIAFN